MGTGGKSFEAIKKLNIFLSFIEIYKILAMLSLILPANLVWLNIALNVFFKPLVLIGISEAVYLFFIVSVVYLLELMFYKKIVEGKKVFLFYTVVMNVVSWITTLVYMYIFGYIANF